MNLSAAEHERLDQLLELLREEQLTPSTLQELEGMVLAHREARRCYLRMTHLDAELRWMGLELNETRASEQAPSIGRRHFWTAMNQPGVFSLVTASSVMFAVVTLLAIWRFRAPEANPTPATPARVASDLIAESAVAIVDAPRANRQLAGSARSFVNSGQAIEIAAGEVRIAFGSGAEVILQGPARFVPRTTHSGYLAHGRLRAHVENLVTDRFTIVTDSAQILDLGTSFEVVTVNPEWTAVRLIKGRVEVRPQITQREPGMSRVLAEGEAVVVDRPQRTILPLAGKKLAALFPAEGISSAAPAPRSLLPVDQGLVVHLDAGNIKGAENAGLSDGQTIAVWRNLAPPEKSLGHFQGTATLRRAGLGQQFTLEFDGQNDHFHNHHTLANEGPLTLFVIAASSERTLGVRDVRDEGQLIGTRQGESLGWALRFNHAGEVIYYHSSYPHGNAVSECSAGFHLFELARSDIQDAQAIRLELESGALVTAPGTPINPATDGTWVGGGKNQLRGQIAEIIAYDRLLSPAETSEVRQFLLHKYPSLIVPPPTTTTNSQ